MSGRPKQLMELLWQQSREPFALTLATEPETFDLDATQFLNPEPGDLNTLVLAPDLHGRQLIADRVPDEQRARAGPSGHWRVWAEVMCWTVQVSIHEKTLPGNQGWLLVGPRSGRPDLVREISERYKPLGARRETADTVRFPDATLAAEFTTDLWALLAEHGAGARFRTTLLATTTRGERHRWTMTRQETLESLVNEGEGKPRRRLWTRRPGQQAKRGGE